MSGCAFPGCGANRTHHDQVDAELCPDGERGCGTLECHQFVASQPATPAEAPEPAVCRHFSYHDGICDTCAQPETPTTPGGDAAAGAPGGAQYCNWSDAKGPCGRTHALHIIPGMTSVDKFSRAYHLFVPAEPPTTPAPAVSKMEMVAAEQLFARLGFPEPSPEQKARNLAHNLRTPTRWPVFGGFLLDEKDRWKPEPTRAPAKAAGDVLEERIQAMQTATPSTEPGRCWWLWALEYAREVKQLRAQVAALHRVSIHTGASPAETIDAMGAEMEALRVALAKAHLCPTVRADGTCDGCFVSAALNSGAK